MEELWYRAILFGPLRDLIGAVAAVLLTSVVFTTVHVAAPYMSGAEKVRFIAILFPLSIAWALCLHFTGSIIASTLFHAGADIMMINGFLAAFRKKELSEDSRLDTSDSDS